MKEWLVLIFILILICGAVKFCIPHAAEELRCGIESVFDPEGFVAAMGHVLSENSVAEVFAHFTDEESEY